MTSDFTVVDVFRLPINNLAMCDKKNNKIIDDSADVLLEESKYSLNVSVHGFVNLR